MSSKPNQKIHNLKMRLASLGMGLLLVSSSNLSFATELPKIPFSLKGINPPETAQLNEFVNNKSAAIALGKAFFWELRMASDGQTACASCHFSSGTDNRIKNTLGPAHSVGGGFLSRKPNETITANDFPFTKFSDVTLNDKTEQPGRDNRDVVSSQGVFLENFVSNEPGENADETTVKADPNFNINGFNTNRVTTRNTPTVINSGYLHRGALDGRVNNISNGVNGAGKRSGAQVYENINGQATPVSIALNDAPLLSLATGPLVSIFEMQSIGRTVPDMGHRVLPLRMLAGQKVASDDGVLGVYASPNGDGLPYTYEAAIRYIFKDKWWNANEKVTIGDNQYTQIEANFSLFFGVAIQLYLASLVSDDSPFDHFSDGDRDALTPAQKRGANLFVGKAKCVNCHKGPLFTDATIIRDNTLGTTQRLERILLANGESAIHDMGFHNIGVTRTEDDIGVGGKDGSGNPLSFSGVAKLGKEKFIELIGDEPNIQVGPNDRIAVDGAFKTPTLRNVALTAPYFHNGGYLTLRSVVDFYNRGGNFPENNFDNIDSNYAGPLGLTDQEADDLVSFLESLTDDRVVNHAAPFDHPSLVVPEGHTGDSNFVAENPLKASTAKEILVEIPAVGRNGYASNAVPTFIERLGINHHTSDVSPDVGEPKPPAPEWTACAQEGGICSFPYGVKHEIRFRIGDKIAPITYYGRSRFCVRHMFGLPAASSKEGVCEVIE